MLFAVKTDFGIWQCSYYIMWFVRAWSFKGNQLFLNLLILPHPFTVFKQLDSRDNSYFFNIRVIWLVIYCDGYCKSIVNGSRCMLLSMEVSNNS